MNKIIYILFALSFLSTTLAYDDLDKKTSEEVFKQEINDLTPYYNDASISIDTMHFLREIAKPGCPSKPKASSIIADFKKLYKKLDKAYLFNPSKGACNGYMGGSVKSGYRDTDNRNMDYVYFYLLLGSMQEYNRRQWLIKADKDSLIKIPELSTEGFACKSGSYFRNYFFDDKSTHYWIEGRFDEDYYISGVQSKEDANKEDDSDQKTGDYSDILDDENEEADESYDKKIKELEAKRKKDQYRKTLKSVSKEKELVVEKINKLKSKIESKTSALIKIMDKAGDTNSDLKLKDRIRFFDDTALNTKDKNKFHSILDGLLKNKTELSELSGQLSELEHTESDIKEMIGEDNQ